MEGLVGGMSARFSAWPQPGFWAGKTVLVTGHTGFKGSWLAIWLLRLGARVIGLALDPETTPNLFGVAGLGDRLDSQVQDIRDAAATARVIRAAQPKIVFHLAAQALVRESYLHPAETFATNVIGTVNVLDAMRGLDSVRVGVLITTDKVYANREWAYPYRETDTLGGHDPYSASKAACEIAISCYRASFLREQGVSVASARAGNVVGGGDWARDRLIPDAINAWHQGRTLILRHPHSVRPWQHVLEPTRAYLVLAERLWENPALADAYNIGPAQSDFATVGDVIAKARAAYARGEVTSAAESSSMPETEILTLETARSRALLGIEPRWTLDQAVRATIAWYREFERGAPALDLCEADLAAFEAMA